jgi:hypothetical protein
VISSQAARLGEEAARRLALGGRHEIGSGLTDAEFARIERDYGFEFADDHRAFLAAGLPLKTREPYERRNRWPDWRDGDPGALRKMLGWPVEGALFDVQYNDLWHRSWGQRPADTSTALSVARRHLARAPKMIPVWGHRYLPAGRGTYGHPVLSIWQTDIIIYGTDLANYIALEFHREPWLIPGWTPPPVGWTPPPMVPFWSDFLLEDLRKPGPCHLSLRVRVDGCESLSAIDGLIPDLQSQSFDYLLELVEFGLLAGIDAEQELPIVRAEDGPSAQGGRMRPDRSIMLLQIPPELTDIRLIELPELHPVVRQPTFYDPGWTQARVNQEQPRNVIAGVGSPEPQHREPVVLPRGPGHVRRHGQGRYRDDNAADSDDSVRIHLSLQTRQACVL